MPFINTSEATKRSKDRTENGKCTNVTNRRSRVGQSTSFYNGQSLKYNRLSKSSWKINKNKSQGFLLMLIEAIKPENIAHFPERILRHFLTRVCESSTHDFYVLPLRICKVKCDWFTRADVTEIALVARRRYFRRNQ